MSLKSSDSQLKLNYDPADTLPIETEDVVVLILKIKLNGRERGFKSQRFEAFEK